MAIDQEALLEQLVAAVRQVWMLEKRVADQIQIVELLEHYGRDTTIAREALAFLEARFDIGPRIEEDVAMVECGGEADVTPAPAPASLSIAEIQQVVQSRMQEERGGVSVSAPFGRDVIESLIPHRAPFLLVDTTFLIANLAKVFEGGWLPLLAGAFLLVVMLTWRAHGEDASVLAFCRQGGDVPLLSAHLRDGTNCYLVLPWT